MFFVTCQAQIERKTYNSSEFPKTIQIPFEKVYLHLDRSYYTAGDDIWFKGYLVNAKSNEFFSNSNNLYVELLSPDSKIIKRLAIRMDKGLGNGDFHLGDSIPSGHGEPLFLIDGMAVDLDVIATFPVSDVDKVEVLKNGASSAIFGMQGGHGVISIFTKQGNERSSKPVFHSINQKVNGFYEARLFYAPKYNVRLPEHEKPDLRTTIHWEPNIITDKNGNAIISFSKADNTSSIKLNIEGISESGIPLTGKVNYEVKSPNVCHTGCK